MRRARIAEWILALVTTKDRAAAVVGDLTEVERGSLWFWWSVIRTAMSITWRDVRAEPWRMTGLNLLGAAVGICCSAAGLVAFEIARRNWPWLHAYLATSEHFAAVEPPYSVGLSWAVTLFGARWIARRAPGREFALFLSGAFFGLIVDVFILTLSIMGKNIHLSPSFVNFSLSFAGTLWARRRPRKVAHA
jgi:hypothetical protein